MYINLFKPPEGSPRLLPKKRRKKTKKNLMLQGADECNGVVTYSKAR